MQADEYIIKQVFSSNDEERKAFMHMDADQVIYYMNERVCNLENMRNLLDYDVKRREQVLGELRTKLDQLNAMRASVHDDGLTVRQLTANLEPYSNPNPNPNPNPNLEPTLTLILTLTS
jgi:hypothetical protein